MCHPLVHRCRICQSATRVEYGCRGICAVQQVQQTEVIDEYCQEHAMYANTQTGILMYANTQTGILMDMNIQSNNPMNVPTGLLDPMNTQAGIPMGTPTRLPDPMNTQAGMLMDESMQNDNMNAPTGLPHLMNMQAGHSDPMNAPAGLPDLIHYGQIGEGLASYEHPMDHQEPLHADMDPNNQLHIYQDGQMNATGPANYEYPMDHQEPMPADMDPDNQLHIYQDGQVNTTGLASYGNPMDHQEPMPADMDSDNQLHIYQDGQINAAGQDDEDEAYAQNLSVYEILNSGMAGNEDVATSRAMEMDNAMPRSGGAASSNQVPHMEAYIMAQMNGAVQEVNAALQRLDVAVQGLNEASGNWMAMNPNGRVNGDVGMDAPMDEGADAFAGGFPNADGIYGYNSYYAAEGFNSN